VTLMGTARRRWMTRAARSAGAMLLPKARPVDVDSETSGQLLKKDLTWNVTISNRSAILSKGWPRRPSGAPSKGPSGAQRPLT
jgi:hypothetical protein